MAESATEARRKSPVNTILTAWLVAGTLDMSTAIVVYAFILHKVSTLNLLYGIASGVFGKDAYEGGTAMAVAGIVFHYIIAFTFTILYFFVFPRISFLKKNWVLSGLLYGVFVWAAMNLVVLPIVFSRAPYVAWSSITAAAILMVMIGLPVAYFTNKYYGVKSET